MDAYIVYLCLRFLYMDVSCCVLACQVDCIQYESWIISPVDSTHTDLPRLARKQRRWNFMLE